MFPINCAAGAAAVRRLALNLLKGAPEGRRARKILKSDGLSVNRTAKGDL